jgi:hypothetical protein
MLFVAAMVLVLLALVPGLVLMGVPAFISGVHRRALVGAGVDGNISLADAFPDRGASRTAHTRAHDGAGFPTRRVTNRCPSSTANSAAQDGAALARALSADGAASGTTDRTTDDGAIFAADRLANGCAGCGTEASTKQVFDIPGMGGTERAE